MTRVMLVDPLQTPHDWLVLQGEMPLRSKPQTPGLTGPQATNDWLTPLRAAVQAVRTFVRRTLSVVRVLLLAAVSWIQEKTGVAPPRGDVFSFSLVEVSQYA